ncbi:MULTISPECIES: hypothetical protein [Pseudomonas]|uniref:Uncharacterized protein n=1 Tax=Pseudomonas mosselii TaxID=78327 RepID=A0A5R8YZX8_9PSED|nr:hypothetical protein [Pseudomonas mosselii]TLP59013.1 hypothetical protein FEM01_13985 [Pseudomonas mosselii]
MNHNIIIAGVAGSRVKRLQSVFVEIGCEFDPWVFTVFAGSDSKEDGLRKVQVEALLDKVVSQGGATVVGVASGTAADRELLAIEPMIRPFFRYRRIDACHLKLAYSAPSLADFKRFLADVLEEECFWQEHIKPKDQYSPLILPEMFLSKKHHGLWRMAESYNGLDNLKGVKKSLARFSDDHSRQARSNNYPVWVDSKERAWDVRGPRHGKATFPETWKYSHQLIEGLHFDVSSVNQRSFEFVDRYKKTHFKKNGPTEYLNVTPFGAVRGKK